VDTEFALLPPPAYGAAKPAWEGKPFLMARTAVSQRVYEALGGQHDSFDWPGDLEPANEVSWNDATAWFASPLLKGSGLRLPSEAEWEFACRAGTETEFCFGNGKTVTSAVVNFDGHSPHGGAPNSEYRRRTVAVGSLPANAFGLHEVHGNVWEWCEDAYSADWRVLRGGCWCRDAGYCRSSLRYWVVPGLRTRACGFRPSRSVEP
jgi:formylglycine-generating enzyme required for sulfatase activity